MVPMKLRSLPMGENTAIEWADHTFNPWLGCDKVGPGCDNCYAARWWTVRMNQPELWNGERRRTTAAWKQPRRWNRRAAETGSRESVFSASHADIFDNKVPPVWRADLFGLTRETPWLDYLILTKRIGNAPAMLPKDWGDGYPNVWIGATICNQEEYDRDVGKLLRVRAVVHFLSMEPLLGRVDMSDRLGVHHHPDNNPANPHVQALMRAVRRSHGPAIDWVITGGESGPGYRHADPDWFRSLRDQCTAAGVPFHFKQWEGATREQVKARGRELDGIEHNARPDPAEFAANP